MDRVLTGLLPGDNVVWEVEGIEDYLPVLGPFCREAARRQRPLIYFRFARHAPLLGPESGAAIHVLNPEEGFERFLTEILDLIERLLGRVDSDLDQRQLPPRCTKEVA